MLVRRKYALGMYGVTCVGHNVWFIMFMALLTDGNVKYMVGCLFLEPAFIKNEMLIKCII